MRADLAGGIGVFSAVGYTGNEAAQTPEYGTEVCVNASLADETKRLFPNTNVHVLADFFQQGDN